MHFTMFFRRLLGETRAATAVEYGLIIAMIVLVMVSSLQSVANTIIDMWGDVKEDVTTADGP